MFESTTEIRVRYAETDQMGIVYYGNYPMYLEVARVEAIRSLGYSYKEMEESGVMMPVVDIHIKYLRPAKYDELLTIKTQVREMPTHKIVFHSQILNEEGKILNKSEVTLFFVDSKTFERIGLPKQLQDKLHLYFDEEA
ncbi:MAG: thioesterase [Pseudopedobacter saltans]|uniref:Thioesterase n=1 Tax=Pseudopedobacter saltans TaxID=151895 RepID=A0A2W5F3Y4_9SPHI|nr:MAG: thioesterase [Pseudopedobacter saltans]